MLSFRKHLSLLLFCSHVSLLLPLRPLSLTHTGTLNCLYISTARGDILVWDKHFALRILALGIQKQRLFESKSCIRWRRCPTWSQRLPGLLGPTIPSWSYYRQLRTWSSCQQSLLGILNRPRSLLVRWLMYDCVGAVLCFLW